MGAAKPLRALKQFVVALLFVGTGLSSPNDGPREMGREHTKVLLN